MSSEEEAKMQAELTGVRRQYRGECPYEKGHSKEGIAFVCGILTAMFFFVAFMGVLSDSWDTWGVKKGYAEYNTTTGKLIWK